MKTKANADPEKVTRNRDRTRNKILAAARDEFAEKGLGGARVENVAARAGSNKRMLYYYFQSKDDLFLVVLEDAYKSIRDAEGELNLLALPPIEAIRKLIAFTWSYFLHHPEFLTLLNSENLHRARHLQGSGRVRSLNSPLIDTLHEILHRGQKQKLFRGGIDPLQLYISIAALSYFYLSNIHTLSAVFGRDLHGAKAQVERLQHMTDMVLGYLLLS
jgi:AcrR family transcriptional regulator